MIQCLQTGQILEVPDYTARDIEVLDPKYHPKKSGLSSQEGRQRLLHDLASIELQALELALRTLAEFPEAPKEFQEELVRLAISECEHLKLCIDGLKEEGGSWGDFPVHLALWKAVSTSDSLLDRILIVHRYLEGSGLDAGSHLVRRLEGIPQARLTESIMRKINEEEVDHVLFGSHWYKKICHENHLDPDHDFSSRIAKLRQVLPKRIEPISISLREKSGFSISEIEVLQNLRESFLKK